MGLRDGSTASAGLFCNRTFDDYACWPDGPPGSFVNVSCPWYLPWASSGECPPPLPDPRMLGQDGAWFPFLWDPVAVPENVLRLPGG